MRGRTASAIVGVALLGGVATAGDVALHHVGPLLVRQQCTATVSGHEVTLSTEQAENAALIAAIAVQRGMPARAASIALATAYQESKLYNLEEGDRDSAGLFQQRPSQGWGTRDQILNPYYATNSFYNALDHVDGYQSMRITVAAQKVQHSGFPEAYADHEADARTLASALTGQSFHAFSCVVKDAPGHGRKKLDDSGLTPRAEHVRQDIQAAFGELSLGGFAPGGVHGGRAIDVSVQPVSEINKEKGWAVAQYLVAQADRLHIETVIFDGRTWKAGSPSGDGWTSSHAPKSSGDHVHVEVYR